jgi:hypothetical protein
VVVSCRRLLTTLLTSCLIVAPQTLSAKSDSLVIDCISPTDPVARTPTSELLGWISDYSGTWNPDNSFSIGGTGAMGRFFAPDGRLMHPAELAAAISRSPNFSGKKKKLVSLGSSDSEAGNENSYAAQLSKLLGTKVIGCVADAYFMQNGAMICGNSPVFIVENKNDPGRVMPAGYALGNSGTLMLFCGQGKETAINPRKILTTSVVYGLFADERDVLIKQAESDSLASFRLYQYYWLSARDPKSAFIWLEKAAAQGMGMAKFNFAYELFEEGGPENIRKAEKLASELVDQGFAGPDLRKIYVGKLND